MTKTIENEVKEQRGGFLVTLATTLGATLMAYKIGKVVMSGRGVIRAS